MSIWNERWEEVDSIEDLYGPDESDYVYTSEEEGVIEDNRPMRTGRHKGLLMANGRRKGLKNLWNSPKFDCWWVHSRMAAYHCHKDDRTYRPWQRDEMKTVRGVPDNDFNEWYDFVEGILQSVYQDSEILIEEGVC